MAIVDEVIEGKARKAMEVLNRNIKVAAIYLFGSQVTGKKDKWSDIDLAIFAEGIERWGIRDRARATAQVQKEAGDDIEIHFFPTHALNDRERDSAGFASWILAHGVQIEP
ncbi:MAG: nucleotidyltransferase domain-containing protein [Thermodesulfobacteriota bacterium]